MKLNPKVFREYDIRGTVDLDLSTDFAYLLGRAYATLALENNKNNIAVGYDCRLSSPSYAEALCKGLADEGISSTNIGMGPTPLVYYATCTHDFGGGIQITGSHNPSDMNGFKICLGNVTLAGQEIQDLRIRCEKLWGTQPTATSKGKIAKMSLLDEYTSYVVENCRSQMGKRKIKVVVDAGNGVGGIVGPKILRELGCEVIELFCEPDGNFPNHHPDPTVMENLEALIHKVKETEADIGIGWDGDADRIGAVDEKGEVIFGDMLLLIYGRKILESKPGATIVGDVKCSALLFEDLKKRGANALMWKTGHSLIKSKLRETQGDLGGEMSGHIFFKHRYFGFDDAVYSSARLVEILSNTDKKASELLADLPKMVSTPEIRVECDEEIKFQIAEKAKSAFRNYKIDTTDGVRIQFDEGWGLIRASNTQPVLVLRFEAKNRDLLDEYQTIVMRQLEELKK